MERRQRTTPQTPAAFVVEATSAIRAVAGADEPLLLGIHPHFHTNPYQRLLYQAVRDHGIAPVGIQHEATFGALEDFQRAGIETVLHLHWLHLVMRDAVSDADAELRLAAFVERLDRYRETGGRLVWTVHNILPHEARTEALEARLCAEVAARADVIHVLAGNTRELVAAYYDLPADRILHVPHPSYAGAYEDHVSRLEARQELGLLPDDLVYLALGAIRPYKGLDALLAAWRRLPPDPRRRLVVAGATTDEPGIAELIEDIAVEPGIVVDARLIPAGEMQLFLRAADVGVLPYPRSLNSGALMLYLTFGLPVVVPSGGGLAEVVDPAFAITFEPGDDEGLTAAILDARRLATREASAAAAAAAARLSPAELSNRFAVGLRERLARSPGT